MGTTYHVNEFDEVVPCLDGRVSSSTSDRRYTTDFEKQLLEEIKDLQTEIEQLKANPIETLVIPKIAGEHDQLIEAKCKIQELGSKLKIVTDDMNDLFNYFNDKFPDETRIYLDQRK